MGVNDRSLGGVRWREEVRGGARWCGRAPVLPVVLISSLRVGRGVIRQLSSMRVQLHGSHGETTATRHSHASRSMVADRAETLQGYGMSDGEHVGNVPDRDASLSRVAVDGGRSG